MKNFNSVWVLWSALACSQAIVASFGLVPTKYYSTCFGKTGAELRKAIHEVINDHTAVPYSATAFDTSDALKILDTDPRNTNNVLLVYSLRSEAKTNFPAVWNREHVWPNSYGLDDIHPAYSDLHNLRPCDENVNSARGNKFYDYSYAGYQSYRSPGHAEAPETATDMDSWQAAPSERGDLARIVFYMDVRYEGDRSNEPDLVITNVSSVISAANANFGMLVALMYWHFEDPVSDAERKRNDGVFGLQKNRNPFVDHPEWVTEVFFPKLQIRKREDNSAYLRWPLQFSNVVVLFDPYTPKITETNSNFVPLNRKAEGDFWIHDVNAIYPEKTFFRLKVYP